MKIQNQKFTTFLVILVSEPLEGISLLMDEEPISCLSGLIRSKLELLKYLVLGLSLDLSARTGRHYVYPKQEGQILLCLQMLRTVARLYNRYC